MLGLPRTHPLFRLLTELTHRNFAGQLGWPDTCHTYRDATLTTITESRSGEHSVRSSSW